MKNAKGMSYIKVLILTLIITILVAGGVYFVRVSIQTAHIKTIKTNMLLVEWKTKEYINTSKASGKEITYIGTKVSDMQNDSAVRPLLDKNIIKPEEYDKYYVLTDSNLETLTLKISNEKNAYYIVNYDTYEVIITSGCVYNKDKTLYKLSEIEAEN